jgi:ribosomal protein L40E
MSIIIKSKNAQVCPRCQAPGNTHTRVVYDHGKGTPMSTKCDKCGYEWKPGEDDGSTHPMPDK